MYKLVNSIIGNNCIRKTNENGQVLLIPVNPDNTDYQAYLKWVAEGNTPTPADEPTQGA
jgi:hypothetical protein